MNTLPSIDVLLTQRLFYRHTTHNLLTNITVLVLCHYYFTVILLQCHTHTQISTSVSSYRATASGKDTMKITHA